MDLAVLLVKLAIFCTLSELYLLCADDQNEIYMAFYFHQAITNLINSCNLTHSENDFMILSALFLFSYGRGDHGPLQAPYKPSWEDFP